MRRKDLFIYVALLLLITTSLNTLLAQEALTQTYTSDDGMFTISYPDGWTVTEDNGLIVFSTDQAYIQINYADYGAEVTPLEVLDYENLAFLGFSEPENLIIAGYAAVQSAGEDQLQTIINFCNGTLGLVFGYLPYGQVDAYKPTLMAMMETIQFGDGEPQVCRGAFEGLQPITSSNAPQLAPVMTLGDTSTALLSVTVSADGSQIAAGTQDGDVWRWNTVTGEALETFTGNRDGATSLAYDDGAYNLAVGTGSGTVRLWDTTTDSDSGTLQEHSTAVESVAFYDFVIASGSLDGEVRLWDMISLDEQVLIVDGEDRSPVTSVAFSPDGMTLAAGGGNIIRLWDVESGTVTAALETEIDDISTLSFHPDGTALIYGGASPSVWIWDLAEDTHALLEGSDEPIFVVAYSRDGQIIATGDTGSLRLWDAATGDSLAVMETPSVEAVNALAFNPAGTFIATVGNSGGVVLWGAASEE